MILLSHLQFGLHDVARQLLRLGPLLRVVPVAFETPYRFMPGGKTLVTHQDTAPNQNLFLLDLETGEQRQLTSFNPNIGSVVQNVDVSPDGKRIVFDRLRNHADIGLMNLAR